ncbi:hypothetical protein SQ11_13525 [Nitrosospira sp. NpAV]|nr:hypothetical protein SQ11_13525 [Nitrosospira sp. NpAV]
MEETPGKAGKIKAARKMVRFMKISLDTDEHDYGQYIFFIAMTAECQLWLKLPLWASQYIRHKPYGILQ